MKLTKNMKNYIETSLANPTLSDAKIAGMIGVSNVIISKWHRNPEFVAEVDKRIREQWHDAVKIAKDTMIELASNGDRQAAQYILDTNGFKPTEKVDVNANINTIKVEVID